MNSLAKNGLAKHDNSGVSSSATDTGRFSRAPASIHVAHFVASAAVPPLFAFLMHFDFGHFFLLGDFGFLGLPIAALISGIIGHNFEVTNAKDLVKSRFPPSDKEILVQAKKKIGVGMKLKMMFHLLDAPITLLSETDKYKMTHQQAELVRRNGGYYIEIETMNALTTWDLALDSVVPKTVRDSLVEAAIARDAKFFADKIKAEAEMRKIWMYEHEAEIQRKQKPSMTHDEDDCYCCAHMDSSF